MRILIVHNTLNDSRSVNGVLRHYVLMARAWIADGHATDFLAARAAQPQLSELAPDSRLISSDSIFNATKRLERRWAYFPAYAYRIMTARWTRLPAGYDVVIASSQQVMETRPAWTLAQRCNAQFAVKIHHVLQAQVKRNSLYDRLFLAAERHCCRLIHQRADVVFCSVPEVAEDYRRLEIRLGLQPREVVVSGYGLDLSEFEVKGEGPRMFDVVFLGRMHEQKGVFDLGRYWQAVRNKLADARMIVIGEGPHRARAEQICRELGLGDSVAFAGGVVDHRKNELLRQSKVGISLSFEEGWGLSICEYLAAGLPVVAYRLPVFEHVFPGQLDEVDLGDWGAAAERTIEWLKDEPRRRARAVSGRQFIARYDYREVARRELGAMQALFENQGSSRKR
jgi:glycosyltransferase involved in cell wall biosynthesis